MSAISKPCLFFQSVVCAIEMFRISFLSYWHLEHNGSWIHHTSEYNRTVVFWRSPKSVQGAPRRDSENHVSKMTPQSTKVDCKMGSQIARFVTGWAFNGFSNGLGFYFNILFMMVLRSLRSIAASSLISYLLAASRWTCLAGDRGAGGGDEPCRRRRLRCRYLVSLRNPSTTHTNATFLFSGWGWDGGVLHAAVSVASPAPRTRSRTCGLTEGALPLREVGRGGCLGGPVPGTKSPARGVWTPRAFTHPPRTHLQVSL